MSKQLSEDLQRFLETRELFGWRLGLNRVSRLARLFGNPQRRCKIIHIAGTNGKGSTAAMLEAVLRAAGYRTGLYTSPHLLNVSERIRIDGLPISIEDFETMLEQQRPLLEKYRATYFEALTTVAFAAFAESKVEVAVVETGLGGRLDATNIVRPLLCVIPSIALDHRQYLGRSLAQIAAEKAGILKRHAPCVIGRMAPQAAKIIASRANAVNAQVYDAWRLCKVRNCEVAEDYNRLSVASDSFSYDGLRCGLVGRHQINNMLCALVGASLLSRRGLQISEAAVRQGLQNVHWPGRFQVFKKSPRLIFDVAHNPAGMRALVDTLREIYPGQRPVALLGILADKDHVKMLQAWKGVAKQFIFCEVQSKRAQAPEVLYRAASKLHLPASVIVEPLPALAKARKMAGVNGIVCVTGSHYLVGELLAVLLQEEEKT